MCVCVHFVRLLLPTRLRLRLLLLLGGGKRGGVGGRGASHTRKTTNYFCWRPLSGAANGLWQSNRKGEYRPSFQDLSARGRRRGHCNPNAAATHKRMLLRLTNEGLATRHSQTNGLATNERGSRHSSMCSSLTMRPHIFRLLSAPVFHFISRFADARLTMFTT